MGVVDEAVEDGADDIVPVLDGTWPASQRATAGIAIVEDLEEVVTSVVLGPQFQ